MFSNLSQDVFNSVHDVFNPIPRWKPTCKMMSFIQRSWIANSLHFPAFQKIHSMSNIQRSRNTYTHTLHFFSDNMNIIRETRIHIHYTTFQKIPSMSAIQEVESRTHLHFTKFRTTSTSSTKRAHTYNILQSNRFLRSLQSRKSNRGLY